MDIVHSGGQCVGSLRLLALLSALTIFQSIRPRVAFYPCHCTQTLIEVYGTLLKLEDFASTKSTICLPQLNLPVEPVVTEGNLVRVLGCLAEITEAGRRLRALR